MSRKDAEAKDEAPDLGEVLSKIKGKFQSFKAKKPHLSQDAEEEILNLSCPCEAENKNHIVDVIVYCSSCSNQLFKKTIHSPYKVAAILAILAYGTSQFVEYVITDNRYPLNVEYDVIDACVSNNKAPMSYSTYGKKKTLCLCAMEETMNEISYVRYQVDEDGFLDAFETNAANCQ